MNHPAAAPARRSPPIGAAWLAVTAILLATPASARVRWGLEGGLNQAEMTLPQQAIDAGFEQRLRPAWSFGPVLEIPLGRVVRVHTGVRYLQTREQHELTFVVTSGPSIDVVHAHVHDVWSDISVPIRLELHPARRHDWTVFAGGDTRYLARASQTFHLDGFEFANGPPGSTTPPFGLENGDRTFVVTSQYRRWAFAVLGGVGFDCPLKGHALVVRAQADNEVTERVGGAARHARGFELTLGWMW